MVEKPEKEEQENENDKLVLEEKPEIEEKENEDDNMFDDAEHAEFCAWVNAHL